ncbi:MAG TPA: MBL fold metallo-hydrolase [Dehalococcoidales bacterium]|nr:MBL fold metallo-hydrolase [Dehalococcoidales bacterium]
MQSLTENIMVHYGTRGANIGLVKTTEGLVMIETPMVPEDAYRLRSEIAAMGKIKYIINTEPHQDHFAGNYYFDGTVVGHDGTRKSILDASMEQFKGMLQMSAPGVKLESDYYFRPPTITFSQSMTLNTGNLTLKLINLPGHTPFQTAVFIPEERVVFTGDNVVRNSMPFLHQALPYAWLDSINQIGLLEVDYIVPGHGEVCGKNYLPEMRANIEGWIQAVLDALNKGWKIEESIARINMLDRYPGDKQRMEFVQKINIENLYRQLSPKT